MHCTSAKPLLHILPGFALHKDFANILDVFELEVEMYVFLNTRNR